MDIRETMKGEDASAVVAGVAGADEAVLTVT
jgi:hypothetical protein